MNIHYFKEWSWRSSKTKQWTGECVFNIEAIIKKVKSQFHEYLATKEDVAREEKCKNLQEIFDTMVDMHQEFVQETRDAIKKYSINMKHFAEKSMKGSKITQHQQYALDSLNLTFKYLYQINRCMLNQINDYQEYFAKEKSGMFDNGDYNMLIDAFTRLLKDLSWEKMAVSIAFRPFLYYHLPPLGYMFTATFVVLRAVKICYPIYLHKVASNQVTQLEKNLKSLKSEWLELMDSLNTAHDSMHN